MIDTNLTQRDVNDWIKCPDCHLYGWSGMFFLDTQEHTCVYCGRLRLCSARTVERDSLEH